MKSVALYNLKLPKELIDIICRFNFYTLSECIEHAKYVYNKVIKEITYIERFQYYGYQPYHKGIYYHIQINMVTTQSNSVEDLYKEMNIYICIKCGEFIKNKCKC